MIWNKEINLEELNKINPSIVKLLDIKFTGWDDNSLTATMPVNENTHQPYGILHGGASVVLAESVGSFASMLVIDQSKYFAVGLEVNANHLRPVMSGIVTAVCTPVHLGGKTHVWDIKISNEEGKMVCISRLTTAIIDKPAHLQ